MFAHVYALEKKLELGRIVRNRRLPGGHKCPVSKWRAIRPQQPGRADSCHGYVTGKDSRSKRNTHLLAILSHTTASAVDQMPRFSASESAARKQRFILILAVLVLAGAAWVYTAHLAWEMKHMDAAPDMLMPHAGPWSVTEFLMLFIMWAVMMIAMMLPSAIPMLLMVAATGQRHRTERRSVSTTALFLSGYLLVWFVFSALATVAQWELHQAALLTPMMTPRTGFLSGTLLIMAGVFQWTSLKKSCLMHCSNPISFVLTHWRSGPIGGIRMGLEHGAYCTGCCWALMAMLFAVGVMNVLWVAGIAAFVLLEKVAPHAEIISKTAGATIATSGLYVLASSQFPPH